MEASSHRRVIPCSTLPPHRWARMRALNDVCQLNEHVLETLSSLVGSGKSISLSVVGENMDLWQTLDAPSRRRAARMPMLFLDLRFQDEVWWQDVATSTPCGAIQDVSPTAEGQWLSGITRQTLMLAWPAVREDRNAAILLYGLSEAVATTIASLTPQQLDHVSLHHSHEMRLRWSGSHGFWRKLLAAAQADDVEALRDLHLYGLQLTGGEMMRVRNGKRSGSCLQVVRASPSLMTHCNS